MYWHCRLSSPKTPARTRWMGIIVTPYRIEKGMLPSMELQGWHQKEKNWFSWLNRYSCPWEALVNTQYRGTVCPRGEARGQRAEKKFLVSISLVLKCEFYFNTFLYVLRYLVNDFKCYYTRAWSTPKSDWLYSLQPKMEKLYTVNKNKTWSWLWLRPWTPYCQIQTEIEESRENH